MGYWLWERPTGNLVINITSVLQWNKWATDYEEYTIGIWVNNITSIFQWNRLTLDLTAAQNTWHYDTSAPPQHLSHHKVWISTVNKTFFHWFNNGQTRQDKTEHYPMCLKWPTHKIGLTLCDQETSMTNKRLDYLFTHKLVIPQSYPSCTAVLWSVWVWESTSGPGWECLYSCRWSVPSPSTCCTALQQHSPRDNTDLCIIQCKMTETEHLFPVYYLFQYQKGLHKNLQLFINALT